MTRASTLRVEQERISALQTLRLRVLKPADSLQVFRLHLAIINSLSNKEFMYAHDLNFFQRLTNFSGRIVGAFLEGQLVGYIAIKFPLVDKPSQIALLARLGVQPSSVVSGAGAGVLPEAFGRGIFGRLLRTSDSLAARLGFRFRSALVHPKNLDVVRCLLRQHYFLASCVQDADGGNYFALKALQGDQLSCSGAAITSGIFDYERNLRYLRQGLCGQANDPVERLVYRLALGFRSC